MAVTLFGTNVSTRLISSTLVEISANVIDLRALLSNDQRIATLVGLWKIMSSKSCIGCNIELFILGAHKLLKLPLREMIRHIFQRSPFRTEPHWGLRFNVSPTPTTVVSEPCMRQRVGNIPICCCCPLRPSATTLTDPSGIVSRCLVRKQDQPCTSVGLCPQLRLSYRFCRLKTHAINNSKL